MASRANMATTATRMANTDPQCRAMINTGCLARNSDDPCGLMWLRLIRATGTLAALRRMPGCSAQRLGFLPIIANLLLKSIAVIERDDLDYIIGSLFKRGQLLGPRTQLLTGVRKILDLGARVLVHQAQVRGLA